MTLSIRNEEVERLARELALQRGVSVTEAIRQSLESALERDKPESPRHGDLAARLLAIADSVAAMPVISDATEDEILGYDEYGIPELPREKPAG